MLLLIFEFVINQTLCLSYVHLCTSSGPFLFFYSSNLTSTASSNSFIVHSKYFLSQLCDSFGMLFRQLARFVLEDEDAAKRVRRTPFTLHGNQNYIEIPTGTVCGGWDNVWVGYD